MDDSFFHQELTAQDVKEIATSLFALYVVGIASVAYSQLALTVLLS